MNVKNLEIFSLFILTFFALREALCASVDNDQDFSLSSTYNKLVLKPQDLREANASRAAVDYLRKLAAQRGVTLKIIEKALRKKLADRQGVTNRRCLSDSISILSSLANGEPWPLRYLDAWGKPPAGFMNGAWKIYGDFDECLNIGKPKNVDFKSKYCRIGVSFRENPIPLDLDISIWQFFPGLMYGLCVPDTCSEDDLPMILEPLLSVLGMTTRDGLTHCHIPHLEKTDLFYIALTIFVVAGSFMLLGLIVDIHLRLRKTGGPSLSEAEKYTIRGHFASLLMCFSPLANIEKLMTFSTRPSEAVIERSPDLSSIHAVRTLSLFWVVLGHVYAVVPSLSDNTLTVGDNLKNFTFQFVMTGVFAVDTFFFLGGFLAYFSIEKIVNSVSLKRKLSHFWSSLPMLYLHRYLRLTPPMAATILIDLGFWAYLYNGPFYFQQVDQACIKGWWPALLYLNNWIENDYMCIGWIWYLAIDTQLFIVAPFVVYLLANTNGQRNKPAVLGWVAIALGFVIQISSAITATVAYNLPITSMNFAGSDPEKNYPEYMPQYYIATYTRMGPYVVGILFAHLTICHFNSLKQGLFSRRYLWAQLLCWFLSIATILTITYGLFDFYNARMSIPIEVEAIYNATARSVWAVAVGWIVMACAMNRAGIVGRILSWPGWAIPARLSYSAYLLHIMVILFYLQTSRRPFYMNDVTVIFMFLATMFATLLVSIPFSLAFESPVINLLHMTRGSPKKNNAAPASKTDK